MDDIGGSVPDRFDQLFGFVTPFRPPVYSTPQARTVEDSTVVGEVDLLNRKMNRGEAVRGTNVLGTAEVEHGSSVEAGQRDPVDVPT